MMVASNFLSSATGLTKRKGVLNGLEVLARYSEGKYRYMTDARTTMRAEQNKVPSDISARLIPSGPKLVVSTEWISVKF